MPVGPIQEAAAAIVALINSNPRSPRPDEIEAIIGRVAVSPGSARASDKAAEWRRAVADLNQGEKLRRAEYDRSIAAGREPTDEDLERFADIDALNARVSSATFAVWKAGANCWADIALFAEVARYWMWCPSCPVDDQQFKADLEPHDIGIDRQSLAQLVNAVLRMDGAGGGEDA